MQANGKAAAPAVVPYVPTDFESRRSNADGSDAVAEPRLVLFSAPYYMGMNRYASMSPGMQIFASIFVIWLGFFLYGADSEMSSRDGVPLSQFPGHTRETTGIVIHRWAARNFRYLSYNYEVEGRVHEGVDSIGQDLWMSLHEGGPVTVTYLDKRPNVSLIEYDPKLSNLHIARIVGVVLAAVGLTGTLVAIRRLRRF